MASGRFKRGVVTAVVMCVCFVPTVNASQSTNFRLDEASIGVSSLLESSSANFRGSSAAGDTAAGPSASDSFQTEQGSKTSPDPNLRVSVDSFNVNFGSLSPTTAATGTATFSIMNYTSYGYVAQIVGSPPRYGNTEISPMGANSASQPGTEQFGLNLVANTSPESYGANPENGTAPNDFGFGEAAPNYDTPNQYRFVDGETIAMAPKSSGVTEYTISYLVNVTSLTRGGTYVADQTLVVTGTY